MSSINWICPKCGKKYPAARLRGRTVCPNCGKLIGDAKSISDAIGETQQKTSTLAFIGGALGLICALSAIVVLFWFDAEKAKPVKVINEMDLKRAEQSKKERERVWKDLKDKLPQKP